MGIFDYLIEMGGRGRQLEPVNFPEDEIILAAPDITVTPIIEKTYINLPPAVYGVLTAPDGQRTIIYNGGLWELITGRYKLHYIDQRERTRLLDNIEGTTSDGFKITVKVQFSYRVTNPEKVLAVDKPVPTLLTTLETAIKNYIISHTHDEIIRPQDSDDSLDDRILEKYVLRQLAQNTSCGGFTVSSLALQDWVGDAKNLELRQKNQILEKESLNKQKQLKLEQNVVSEEKELERKKGEVKQTQADSEYAVQQALAKVQQLKIELEQSRNLPERSHKEIMNVLEAIKEMPGFPRKAIEDLTNALIEKTKAAGQPIPSGGNGRATNQNQEQKVSDLAQTILGLVKPKKK